MEGGREKETEKSVKGLKVAEKKETRPGSSDRDYPQWRVWCIRMPQGSRSPIRPSTRKPTPGGFTFPPSFPPPDFHPNFRLISASFALNKRKPTLGGLRCASTVQQARMDCAKMDVCSWHAPALHPLRSRASTVNQVQIGCKSGVNQV
jgi:hypothetical protein